MATFQTFWFAYIALVLLSASIWERSLWGLHFWGMVSEVIGLFLFLLVLGGYLWKKDEISQSTEVNTKTGSKSIISTRGFVTYIVVSTLLFVLMRTRHLLWGGIPEYIESFFNSTPAATSSPASWLINMGLFRFLNSVFILEPSTTASITSILAGIMFVITSILVVRNFERFSKTEHSFAGIGLILMNGYIAVFFATPGKASISVLFVLLFLHSSILVIQRGGSLVLPSIFLLLSMLSQPSASFLVFPYLYLLRIVTGRERSSIQRAPKWSIPLALILLVLVLSLPKIFHLPNPAGYISELANLSIKNTLKSLEARPVKTLFDALNELLLLGPATVAGILLLFKKVKIKSGMEGDSQIVYILKFLSIGIASSIALIILSAWKIDSGLNWHILASTGPVFALYTLWKLKYAFRKQFLRVAYLIMLIGAFQTFPWLLVNSSGRLAEKRLLSLPLAPGRAEAILAEQGLRDGSIDHAEKMLLKSLEKNPGNPATNFLLGKIKYKKEEYLKAIGYLSKALEADSTNVQYRFYLASAYNKNRWLENAIYEFSALTEEYPDSVRFWLGLGYAYNHSWQFEKALKAYRKAYELQPQSDMCKRGLVSALVNRGTELYEKKKPEEARRYFLEAISIIPTAWGAYNNLVVLEINEGNLDVAEEIARDILELQPSSADLNFNMGMILEKKGNIEGALKYYEKSVKLNPMYIDVKNRIDSLKAFLKIKE